MQLDFFPPVSDWRPPRIGDLPSWAGAKRIAFDLETKDPYLRNYRIGKESFKGLGPGCRRPGGRVVGFSFALEDGPYHYIPLSHEGGDNVEDEAQAWAYLRAQSDAFTGEIVGQNLSYDLDWAANYGVLFPKVRYFRDIMVADSLIYELHHEYGLDAIAKRRGFVGKNEALLKEAAAVYRLKNVKGEMYKLAARYVGPYGEDDARLPLKILAHQQKDIDEQGLQNIFDLESDLLPVLVRMRRRGVRIDFDQLARVENWSYEQEALALARIKDITGHSIELGDVWKPDAVAPALTAIGMRLARTEKTNQIKVDSALLKAAGNPTAAALLHARKVNKLRTTFAQSIRRFAVNGRIHTTFNQLKGDSEDGEGGQAGARFGRLSSKDPNLQAQPSRDDFAKAWRSIYIPEEGCLWGCADISQQEPRWAVHFAHKTKKRGRPLRGAAEMVRRYNEDPSTDSHSMIAEISGLPRKYAKALGLGLMYGEGGAKMCRDMGLPTRWCVFFKGETLDPDSPAGQRAIAEGARVQETAGAEGQRIINTFDEKVPFVRELAKFCQKVARQRGYITTVLGRRCRFPEENQLKKADDRVTKALEDGDASEEIAVIKALNYEWTHKALNRLIQGSSGDQMKKAMIEVDRAGHFLQLQVHDEVDLSIADRAEGEAIAHIVANAVIATVPFKIDLEIGPNWGEIA